MKIRIKQAALKLGISPDTIRGLERRGLLTLDRDYNGHRRIGPDDLKKIENIIFRKGD